MSRYSPFNFTLNPFLQSVKPLKPPEPKSELSMIYGWTISSPKLAALAMVIVDDGDDVEEVRSGDFDNGVYDGFSYTEYKVGEETYKFQVENWERPISQWRVHLAVDLGTHVDSETLKELIHNTKEALSNPKHDLFRALSEACPDGIISPNLSLRKIVKDW